MDFVIVIILLLFSAMFSGLTLGFMSLSKDELERKIKLVIHRYEKNRYSFLSWFDLDDEDETYVSSTIIVPPNSVVNTFKIDLN